MFSLSVMFHFSFLIGHLMQYPVSGAIQVSNLAVQAMTSQFYSILAWIWLPQSPSHIFLSTGTDLDSTFYQLPAENPISVAGFWSIFSIFTQKFSKSMSFSIQSIY